MKPPAQFLLGVSQASLEGFEGARLNQAAIIRKELRTLIMALVEEEAQAQLARWMIDNREELMRMGAKPVKSMKTRLEFIGDASEDTSKASWAKSHFPLALLNSPTPRVSEARRSHSGPQLKPRASDAAGGLSTEDVARRVGITPGTLARWIGSGKIQAPELQMRRGGSGTGARTWTEADIAKLALEKKRLYKQGRWPAKSAAGPQAQPERARGTR